MNINEKYENVDDYRFVERKSKGKSMKPKRRVTMEDLFDDSDNFIVDEEIASNEKVAYVSKSKNKDITKTVDDLKKKKISAIVVDNVNEGEDNTIELFYTMDNKGSVKNISKTHKDAKTFLEKSLKGNGKIGYKDVLKSDYNNEKVTVSNIKTYKMNEGGCGCGGKKSINESIDVEKTKTGYLILSKRLNNGDLFKRKYMDNTEKEAKVKFKREFNKENEKTLKEGGCGCGGGKTLREADIMGRRSLPGIGGAAPGVGMYNKISKDNAKTNKSAYEESMKKVSKYNDIKLKQPMIDNEGVIKTATSGDDKYTKKYAVKDEEEYIDQLARTGSGMESLDYDTDPSDVWKEKFKKNLNGDESFMSKLTKKRKEIKLNSPVYNIFPKYGKIGDQVNVFNGMGKNKNVEKLNREKGMKESVESIVDRIIEEAIKMKEGKKSKPDFLDLDKDGNKKEPMKKASKDAKMKKSKSKIFKKKEVKESEGWMTILNNDDMKEINSTPQPKVERPSANMSISSGFASINLGTLRVENAENLNKVVIPSEYQVNGLVFEIADNNRTAKVRFEEGELIVLADKNKKMINEEASKIMKLMNYNYNTKPAAKSVVNEDVNATLKKMLNEVKGLAKQ